jgi:hypothetical protein
LLFEAGDVTNLGEHAETLRPALAQRKVRSRVDPT